MPSEARTPEVNRGVSGTFSSRGALVYAGRGNHLTTFASREWEGLEGYWLRVELWRDDNDAVRASTYYRMRGNWLPYRNSELAMQRDAMLRGITP